MPDLQAIQQGEIVLLRNFDVHRRIVDVLLAAIARACGSCRAVAIRRAGIERLHEHTTPRQMIRIVDSFCTHPRTSVVVSALIEAFEDLWVSSDIGLFIHPPQAQAVQLIGGHHVITPLNPHVDRWGDLNRNKINVWYAVTRVAQSNGLVIYKDAFDKPLRVNAHGYVLPGQKFPKPHLFEVPAGQALVYSSDHVHASHLNVTNETRVVLTLRLALERPRQEGWSLSRLFKWHRTRSRLGCLSMSLWQNLARRGRRYRLALAPNPVVSNAPRLGRWVTVGTRESFREPRTVTVEGRCLAVFPRGDRFEALDGQCPHAGGRLADGYREGDTVTCPFHALRFDLTSGQCVNWPEAQVAHYPTRVESDRLWVEL